MRFLIIHHWMMRKIRAVELKGVRPRLYLKLPKQHKRKHVLWQFCCTLERLCLVWKGVKDAQWEINYYSVLQVLMNSYRFSKIIHVNCKVRCFPGISFLTNLTLFIPIVFDLLSIHQLSGKHQAQKLLIRYTAQRTQAVWKAQQSFQGSQHLNSTRFSFTNDILYSLFGSAEFIINISLVQFWSQVNKCNYSYLSSKVILKNHKEVI